MLLARIRRPSEKPLLAVFLAATLALCVWLAYQAVDAARSQRRTAEGVLGDYAEIAAAEFIRTVGEELDDFLDEVFDDVPRRTDRDVLPDAVDLIGDVDRGLRQARCVCPSLRQRIVIVRADVPSGAQVELPAGMRPTDAAPLERLLRGVLDSRPDARAGVFMGDVPAVSSPAVVAYAVTRSNGGVPRAIYGIAMDPSGVEELFTSWYVETPLLPEAVARGLPNDSLVSVTLHAPTGELLFRSRAVFPAEFARTDQMADELGALVVEAQIRPDAAEHLVIGGLPASRLPLLSTLLILTLGLGVAAWTQVRRQQQLAELREDFVSGVSHEFRTPLTQIRLFAELLRDGKLDAEEPRHRALSVINREASRLTHLVENVLRFSSLRHGNGEAIRSEDVDVGEVVDEVLEAFGPLADDRGTRVDADIDGACIVQGSRSALHQILTNLLDNALKYGPAGQTVQVSAKRRDGVVHLSVEDEGPGVPAAQRDHIWEPYRRLQEDVSGHVRGSGIGLAVVAELAGAVGGRAWVEDRDGPGSRFVVELVTWSGALENASPEA